MGHLVEMGEGSDEPRRENKGFSVMADILMLM
jgi:hypothetical protein